jgi:hypothetical protein
MFNVRGDLVVGCKGNNNKLMSISLLGWPARRHSSGATTNSAFSCVAAATRQHHGYFHPSLDTGS